MPDPNDQNNQRSIFDTWTQLLGVSPQTFQQSADTGSGTITLPEITIVGDPSAASSSSDDPSAAGVVINPDGVSDSEKWKIEGPETEPASDPKVDPYAPTVRDPNGPDSPAPDTQRQYWGDREKYGSFDEDPSPKTDSPGSGAGDEDVPDTLRSAGNDAVEAEEATETADLAVEGTEAATAGGVGAAGAVVAAGVAVGIAAPIVVGYAQQHAEELRQQTDPDEKSLPGGAPPQQCASDNDGDAGTCPQNTSDDDGDAGAPPQGGG